MVYGFGFMIREYTCCKEQPVRGLDDSSQTRLGWCVFLGFCSRHVDSEVHPTTQ